MTSLGDGTVRLELSTSRASSDTGTPSPHGTPAGRNPSTTFHSYRLFAVEIPSAAREVASDLDEIGAAVAYAPVEPPRSGRPLCQVRRARSGEGMVAWRGTRGLGTTRWR